MDNSKPYVICHMMTSIDGKISSGEDVDVLGEYYDLYAEIESTYNPKSWLLGRVTMEMFASKESSDLDQIYDKVEEGDFIVAPISNYFLFGVDSKGILRWNKNSVKFSSLNEELNLVMVLTETTPKEYLQYLRQKRISYIIAGKNEIDFDLVLRKIKNNFHQDKLILEGGGLINGSLLESELIDEISLLLTPITVNKSSAPALFERKNDNAMRIDHFKLVDFQKLKQDCIWIKYKK